jgi:hypothetical protein
MKKMPTLFKRKYFDNGEKICINEITPGCEWVFTEDCTATEKLDGTCCLIEHGNLYRRYDVKNGRTVPPNAIPCQEKPDPITGHWPHWILVDKNNPNDKWHIEAWDRFKKICMEYNLYIIDGTYELCGPHFKTNSYNLQRDTLFQHR